MKKKPISRRAAEYADAEENIKAILCVLSASA